MSGTYLPYKLRRVAKRIGLKIGRRGVNNEFEFQEPTSQLTDFFAKVEGNRKYAAARKLAELIFARAMKSQGQTKFNNQWVQETLANYGMKMGRRQISRWLKKFQELGYIHVQVIKHYKGDSFAATRHVTVIPVLALFRYKIVNFQMWSDDTRPSRNEFLQNVPMRFKIAEERPKYMFKQLQYVQPEYADQGELIEVGRAVPQDFVTKFRELNYEYDAWDAADAYLRKHARRVLGYPLNIRYMKHKNGVKINEYVPGKQGKVRRKADDTGVEGAGAGGTSHPAVYGDDGWADAWARWQNGSD